MGGGREAPSSTGTSPNPPATPEHTPPEARMAPLLPGAPLGGKKERMKKTEFMETYKKKRKKRKNDWRK
ncbi:hypothetical protein E2C01_075072 [Portunus trituberculatus]|uniref:Uncharacterized protein n=1 Tax=Portunus trituberculatus TaxID=210409 RepID=A0A5B7I9S1_PORTR|nr:hypothetical protein [Portunus trituberculatus]